MRTKIALCGVGLLLLVSPLFASAQPISEIQAQIQALLARLAALQAQQTSQTVSTSTLPTDNDLVPVFSNACPNLTMTLTRGSRDARTNGQVTELQIFLAEHFNLNENDVVTGYYGQTTERYVRQFQQQQGLEAVGFTGARTRAAIARVCGGTISIPISPPNPIRLGVPVISSFSGPTTLQVNQTGTWTVTASDPENGQLTYRVTWGDEQGLFDQMLSAAFSGQTYSQNTSFTHSYASAGMYMVTVVVRDASGLESRTSTTVRVGGPVACPLYAQTDTLCAMGQQWRAGGTDSNGCLLPGRCAPIFPVGPLTVNAWLEDPTGNGKEAYSFGDQLVIKWSATPVSDLELNGWSIGTHSETGIELRPYDNQSATGIRIVRVKESGVFPHTFTWNVTREGLYGDVVVPGRYYVYVTVASKQQGGYRVGIAGPVWIGVPPQPTASLTLTAPNGGEQWEVGTMNTITWTPYGYNPDINPPSQVTAYLEQYGTGPGGEPSYFQVGKIVPSGKASIHWESLILNMMNEQVFPQPGSQYYVRVVNNVTGQSDRSNAAFTLLPKSVNLKINGSDGPIAVTADQKVTATWDATNVTRCELQNAYPDLSRQVQVGSVPTSGSREVYLHPSFGPTMSCYKADGKAVYDYVATNVLSVPTTLQVLDPNYGGQIPIGQVHKIQWKQTGLSNVSIALYRDDQWKQWIAQNLTRDKSPIDTYSYDWAPAQTDANVSAFKIYITGQKADGSGYIEDKSDTPFSFVGPVSGGVPRVSFFSVYYDNESTGTNQTKIQLGTESMKQCDLIKANAPGGNNALQQFNDGRYTVLQSGIGIGGAFGTAQSVIKVNVTEPVMLVAARCLGTNGVNIISPAVYLHKEFPNADPKGWLDNTSSAGIWGWSCDYNDYSMPIRIHLYADGPYQSGVFLGKVVASSEREAAVGHQCGNITAHGFSTTIDQLSDRAKTLLRDGRSHQIYAYAINYPTGNNPQLAGSPKTLQGTPQPGSPSIENGASGGAQNNTNTNLAAATVAYQQLITILQQMVALLK